MGFSPRPSGPVTISGAPVGETDEASTLGVAEEERYRDGALLGRGGMGEVRTVRDQRLDRDVARKVLVGRDPYGEARLAREARITARLEHPGIVPVYDAGRTEDGRPWYTMRVIRGRDLAQALADSPDPVARAALLRHFLDACEAVGFAHSLRVVHRDLKPANILVGAFGETQVADWGLARELGPVPVDDEDLTEDGEVVGTPAYMSPEQARGAPAGPRSDVWSLGAILFEILTGEPLWTGSDSAVVHKLLTESPTPVLAVRPDAPAELAAIAERALERDPAARYPSAIELARDLARWFDGRPVSAYEYSAAELLWRAVKAWRVPLAFATVAGGVGLALAGAAWTQTTWERDRAVQAEAATRDALATADANLALLQVDRAREALERADRPTSERLAAEALAMGESAEARGILAAWAASPRPSLLSRRPLGPCDQVVADPTGSAVVCPGPDGVVLWQEGERTVLPGSPQGVGWTGSQLVLTDMDRGVVWHGPDGAEQARVDAPALPRVAPVPGSQAVVLYGSGHFRVVGLDRPESILRPCGAAAVTDVGAVGPDRLFVACDDGALLVGDLDEPGRETLWVDPALRAASLGIHGELAVLGTLEGEVLLVAPDGVVRHRVRHGELGIRDAAVDPSGQRVVVTGARGRSALLDLHTGAVLTTFPGRAEAARWASGDVVRRVGEAVEDWSIPSGLRPVHWPGPEGVAALDLSGDRVAVAHGDGTLVLWDLPSGRPVARHRWQEGVAKAVAFSPDGTRLAAVAQQVFEVRVFDRSGLHRASLPSQRFRRLVWSAGGLVGLPYSGPALVRWDPVVDGEEGIGFGEGHWVDLEAAPDGTLVGVDREGRVWLRREADARVLHTDPRSVGVVAQGAGRVATGLPDAVLLLEEDGSEVGRVTGCGTPVDLALSGDGRWLAVGAADGRVTVWDVEALEAPRMDLRAHREQVSAVRFGDGDVLFTGSWDRTTRVWDLSVLDAEREALAAAVGRAWGRGGSGR